MLPKWTPALSLLTTFDHQSRPGSNNTLAIEQRVSSHLLLGFGIAGWTQLDLDLPLVAYQRGTGYEGGEFVELRPQSIGDLRIGLKGTILRTPRRGFGLGLGLDVTAPTGDSAALSGFGKPSYAPQLLLEYRAPHAILLDLNAGYVAQPEFNRAGVVMGDAVTYRAAIRVPLSPREQVAVFTELDGSASLVRGGTHPLAARGGFRWQSRVGMVMNLYAGGALIPALGVPQVQVGLSVGFAPASRMRNERAFPGAPRPSAVEVARRYDRVLFAQATSGTKSKIDPADPDGDGIIGRQDRCPSVAEDLDGFEDDDGCPELDNDVDGLRDSVDLCPAAPEVINGYLDGDGCPDKRVGKGGETFAEFDARRILPAIHFEAGTSTLSDHTRGQLDELAELMRLNPWIERVQLAVYVKYTGNPVTDRGLSYARTTAISNYLAQSGVERWRIEHLPAKTLPEGISARVRLSFSGRAQGLRPAAPPAETLQRMIAEESNAARERSQERLQRRLNAPGPTMEAQGGTKTKSKSKPKSKSKSRSR